jgi:hypothetical protein
MYFVLVLILTIWIYILYIIYFCAESKELGEKNPGRLEDFGEAFAG